MSTGYKIKDQEEIYFLTLRVVDWIDIFTRDCYRDLIIENLAYCQKHKGLTLFAYVIMSNHLHILAKSEHSNLSDIIRDFKSYTSKQLINSIQSENESRREWMIFLLQRAAKKHKRNAHFQVWNHDNHAELIYSDKFIVQKLEYIHNNPVKARIVEHPENYLFSSARNYAGLDSLLDVEILTLPWKTY